MKEDKWKITWRGKDLTDCSKEELINCINDLADQERSFYRYRESKENQDLKAELKFKNEFIDKLVNK